MIVRNEEAVLDDCLNSAKDIADEIIIVDTGSTDKTKEIARKYTDKIYDFKWIDDFAAARNFSLSKASMDYIFWLDADDVVPPESRDKIIALKKNPFFYADMGIFTYNYSFDENGNVTMSQLVERLLKRECGFKWIGRVHEYIPQQEKTNTVFRSDIQIDHRCDEDSSDSNERNIRILETMMLEGEELTPREKYLYGRELRIAKRYAEAIPFLKVYVETKDNIASGTRLQAVSDAAFCEIQINNDYNAEMLIHKYLETYEPDAQLFCLLGTALMHQKRFEAAINAYSQATLYTKTAKTERVTRKEFSGGYAFMKIAECCIALKNKKLAEMFNNKAAELMPDNPEIKKNSIRIKLML